MNNRELIINHRKSTLLRCLFVLCSIRSSDTAWTAPRSFGLQKCTVGTETKRCLGDEENDNEIDRRRFLVSVSSGAAATFSQSPSAGNAMGLVQFPCTRPLANRYHLMRTGLSLLEEDDIWSTNPLFLTNREAALSARGVRQVEEACKVLQSDIPTQVRYSLAANAIDTATIFNRELRLARNIVLPEYTFLDPRALGRWEALGYSETHKAVWAMDVDEAGKDGTGARPPPNDDGTPNETLADQGVRLRQIMSILETQYSGDTVLLVFTDGTGPALLSALIAGIPLNRVHELEFQPGEVRLDVTPASTQRFWKARSSLPEDYEQTIEQGRTELDRLRSLPTDEEILNLKDKKLEKERLVSEQKEAERKQERILRETKIREERDERQRQVAEARKAQQEKERLDLEQKETERKEKEMERKKERIIRETKLREEREERERRAQESIQRQLEESRNAAASSAQKTFYGGNDISGIDPVVSGAAAAIAVGGITVAVMSNDEEEVETNTAVVPSNDSYVSDAVEDKKEINVAEDTGRNRKGIDGNLADADHKAIDATQGTVPSRGVGNNLTDADNQKTKATRDALSGQTRRGNATDVDHKAIDLAQGGAVPNQTRKEVDGNNLADANNTTIDATLSSSTKHGEEALLAPAGAGDLSIIDGVPADSLVADPVLDRVEAAEKAMEEYMNSDDGGEAWAMMMADIAREDDGGTGER